MIEPEHGSSLLCPQCLAQRLSLRAAVCPLYYADFCYGRILDLIQHFKASVGNDLYHKSIKMPEWVDPLMQKHRSAPSPPISTTYTLKSFIYRRWG